MTMHTPAPWAFDAEPGRRSGLVYQDTGEDEDTGICKIFADQEITFPDKRRNSEFVLSATRVADARLIAAAPDLLAALTECADYLAEFMEEGRDHRVIKNADSAIAKARAEE